MLNLIRSLSLYVGRPEFYWQLWPGLKSSYKRHILKFHSFSFLIRKKIREFDFTSKFCCCLIHFSNAVDTTDPVVLASALACEDAQLPEMNINPSYEGFPFLSHEERAKFYAALSLSLFLKYPVLY